MDLREVLRTSSLRSLVHVVSLAAGILSTQCLAKGVVKYCTWLGKKESCWIDKAVAKNVCYSKFLHEK